MLGTNIIWLGLSHAYCLYSIWECVVELQGVVILETWQVSVDDLPGHLALWLAAIQCSAYPFISCTQSMLHLAQLSRRD